MRLAALYALLLLAATPVRADVENALSAFEDGDYVAARQQAEPLATAGEASAQFLLGLIYDRGYGTEPDEIQAAYWYSKAADQGLQQAPTRSPTSMRAAAGSPAPASRSSSSTRPPAATSAMPSSTSPTLTFLAMARR